MVCIFRGDWPYNRPVFVWSETLTSIPDALRHKVEIVRGQLSTVLASLEDRGFSRLKVGGGKTIHRLLAEDLVDELIISRIPILLGGGPLFDSLPAPLQSDDFSTGSFAGGLVKSQYARKR